MIDFELIKAERRKNSLATQLRSSPTQLQLIAGLTAPPAINGIECCWLPLPYRAA